MSSHDVHTAAFVAGNAPGLEHAVTLLMETDRLVTITGNRSRAGDYAIMGIAEDYGFAVIPADSDDELLAVADRLYVFHAPWQLDGLVNRAAEQGKEVYEYLHPIPGMVYVRPRTEVSPREHSD